MGYYVAGGILCTTTSNKTLCFREKLLSGNYSTETMMNTQIRALLHIWRLSINALLKKRLPNIYDQNV